MKKEYLRVDEKEYRAMQIRANARAVLDGGLCKSLWAIAAAPYDRQCMNEIWSKLTAVYGKAPSELKTAEEFWAPQLKKAVTALVGAEMQAAMEEMTRMRMECQFSNSMLRRSYRSADFGYHAYTMIFSLGSWISWTTYKKSVKEMLYYQHDWIPGLDMFLALELRRDNREIVEMIKEAMFGDTQEILLSHVMIRAVVISGHEELIKLLLKLLLAARLQEGLRQQILEQADAGSINTLVRIIKLCIDEDMFRYSSTVRAFDVWTGLGYENTKASAVKKYAVLAYECLTDETARQSAAQSENNLEAYLAIWAMGCHDVEETNEYVEKLMCDQRKYRRALGWYFVTNTDSSGYRMRAAGKYIGEADDELLAWAVSNLAVTPEAVSGWCYNEEDTFYGKANPDLPETSEERKALFEELAGVADRIGNRKSTFTGNPFPFSSITLENSNVIGCMMSLAYYDFDEYLIVRLASFLPLMNADQRLAFYRRYLSPKTNRKHREILRGALKDRSIQVKEAAAQKLAECNLTDEDMEALAESMRSKSNSFRSNILEIFKEQEQEKLSMVIGSLLRYGGEYQIQAGIELLLEFREKYPEMLEQHADRIAALEHQKLSSQTKILLEQIDAVNKATLKDAESTVSVGGADTLGGPFAEYNEENGFGLYDPGYIESFVSSMGSIKKGSEVYEMGETGKDGRKVGTAAMPLQNERKGLLFRLLGGRSAKTSDGAAPGRLYSLRELKALLIPPEKELNEIFDRMNAVFDRHADYEYETLNYDGSREKVLFGFQSYVGSGIRIPAEFGEEVYLDPKLEMIPFHEEFLEAAGEYASDLEKCLKLCFALNGGKGVFWQDRDDTEFQAWFRPIAGEFQFSYKGYNRYEGRYFAMMNLPELMLKRFDSHEIFTYAFRLYQSALAICGDKNLGKNCVQKKENSRYYWSDPFVCPINLGFVGYWRSILSDTARTDEDFREWFLEEFCLEHRLGKDIFVMEGLQIKELFRACDMGLVEQDIIYESLLLGQTGYSGRSHHCLSMLTRAYSGSGRKKDEDGIFERYEWARDLVDKTVLRIVEVEEKRGELPTPLTGAASAIEYFTGAEHFARLLAALGKENFFRGYEYSYDTNKRAVLSRLLKRCYPAKEDTEKILAYWLSLTDIDEKRLAEAVMYAPQWAGLAEKMMGWDGLKCGVWFFHAHINESFSAEKETEVALYSPISPQEFNDGAFDREWLFKAYKLLGEKRFEILYLSAKYITSGSNQHRRSQLYTDAALGRLDEDMLKEEISDKRNQDKLRCLPLLPLDDGAGDNIRSTDRAAREGKGDSTDGADGNLSSTDRTGHEGNDLSSTDRAGCEGRGDSTDGADGNLSSADRVGREGNNLSSAGRKGRGDSTGGADGNLSSTDRASHAGDDLGSTDRAGREGRGDSTDGADGRMARVLSRYEFIQQFLKESRQFGAQRRESERKAALTALENLALTAGFADVDRMTWYLESERMAAVRPLTEPASVGGDVTVWLEIGADGGCSLAAEKGGKRLKTIPKALAGQERVQQIKAAIKVLTEQRRRAKESFERSMTQGSYFRTDELCKLAENPVLAPIVFSLVWTDGEHFGFIRENNEKESEKYAENVFSAVCRLTIKGLQNESIPVNGGAELKIAHPHDLQKAGLWADYMHFIYEHKITQPFKQVFREYYPITEDERQEKNLSRRYAGYQVQPKKTVALLRGRGWTVDYEEGLQKVFYKENIVVRMYAMADWFSPADTEAPTLEVIRFFDKNSGDVMDLENVPPILFSETMRDIDLAVSVAHVGGVDPEASHSTVEMRRTIAEELVHLLKLENVSFVGSHATIRGKLANYSVHMGSGVVHAEAVGMLAILPVHSQDRGRIFLPFADDDPKTAEIMSKIIILSEDGKIKDTSILSQIQG